MSEDDPKIVERKHAREVKKANEQVLAATVADRLTKRGRDQTADIVLTDPDGDLVIPMRLPNWGTTCELSQIETLMGTQKGRTKLAKIMTGLSIEPSMDGTFWSNETIGLVDMKLLIEGLTTAALKRMQEVKQFRPK